MRLFFDMIGFSEAMAMTKGEATRQRIIAAAAPIFNQRGFDGCSMQDLMSATGLEKGGIYRHFANKQDLAAEAFNFALTQNVKVRTDHLDDIPGAIATLRAVIKIFVETPSVVPGGCPLMNTAIDADDGNEVLRDLARKGIQDWRTRLCTIVEAGIAKGEIRKKTDPRRVANTIIATLEGALMISRLENSKTALHDAQTTLDILLDDIIPKKAK
jgi:TetR/AcrR family transcriptional repressor of nem operon